MTIEANILPRAICHSSERYTNPGSFDPNRYLLSPTPAKIQGHTVFGYGRRVCIGQDYAASQMLVVCATVANFFDISLPVDKVTGQPISVEKCFEGATGNVIPVLDCVDLGFQTRDERTGERLRDLYAMQREQDVEKEEEECF